MHTGMRYGCPQTWRERICKALYVCKCEWAASWISLWIFVMKIIVRLGKDTLPRIFVAFQLGPLKFFLKLLKFYALFV